MVATVRSQAISRAFCHDQSTWAQHMTTLAHEKREHAKQSNFSKESKQELLFQRSSREVIIRVVAHGLSPCVSVEPEAHAHERGCQRYGW
mmetsp:Transcript_27516/g.44294  ORF Transcript_27516/g.44294 Transcript_27516/m.44294 type:complete len:90 (+) Transcript_27516:219-488(+)